MATLRHNRKFGGYIVHLGMVLIFIGIAGSSYKRIHEVDLAPGQSTTFENFRVDFLKYSETSNSNHSELYAILDVFRNDGFIGQAKPAKFFYFAQQQPSTEVSIIPQWDQDVYFTLGAVDENTQKARIQLTLNPLIGLVWWGGFILVIGGLISMMPSLRLDPVREPS